ncbi:MAG TPA: thiosulfate oxidation carrier protein SoxY [Methylococcaceae bacterium]|nr:thiosulfate oxidation carrier protein SoxY [Methylococcaceae bacterium]
MTRRQWLKLLASLPWLGVGGRLWAATPFEEAWNALLGGARAELSDDIRLELPELAEDGAQVPLTLSVAREDVEALFVLAEMNPVSLVAGVELAADALPYLAARVRLNGNGVVWVVARCRAGWFYARREARVARGGACG